MIKIDYAEWQLKRKEFRSIRDRARFRRQGSNRFRDPEERELLMKADKARMDRWIASGRLTFVTPRRIIFNTKILP